MQVGYDVFFLAAFEGKSSVRLLKLEIADRKLRWKKYLISIFGLALAMFLRWKRYSFSLAGGIPTLLRRESG